jgi:acetoacetyl-CoA synthetase
MNTIVWQPKNPEHTRMWAFMRHAEKVSQHPLTDYQSLHTWSVQNPGAFWQTLCEFFQIRFDTPAKQPLNTYSHMLDARFFEGATLNFAAHLLSRDDDHPALICINEAGKRQVYTYHSLKVQVAQCAEGLKQAGVICGDRVAAVMPNTAYAIIAMLATASIGAIWSSCSPDFGVDAIIDRFKQIEPKVLFICDGYLYQGKPFDTLEKLTQIYPQIPSLTTVVICPYLRDSQSDHTILWSAFLKPATTLNFASLPFHHPLYILFSSGTTGAPKCIVHGAGGTLLQHMKELGLHTDLRADDNLCFYTTCGWMMWNWMVSALALGATLTLYEGAATYPDAYRLFQIMDAEGVTVFGTSAKFISTVKKSGALPRTQYPLKSLRTILSTGSPLLPQHYDFVYQQIKPDVQLCSISGGTDIVSCFALGNPIRPIYRGELQCIGLGMDVVILDEEGHELQQQAGELVCKTPFPSMPIYFWNDDSRERYQQAYFSQYKGLWAHGDRAALTEHGGLIIYGRSDTVLNPGGVRIGTAEIYHQIEKIEEIIDSVVIGQPWQDDVRIVLFVKLREGVNLDETLVQKICTLLKTHASPRHVPAKILQVHDIPRTINGKIVELAVRDTVMGNPIKNRGSIANPEALAYFMNRPELV